MIFHGNRLLADDSHEIQFLISFKKLERRRNICRLLNGAFRVSAYPANGFFVLKM